MAIYMGTKGGLERNDGGENIMDSAMALAMIWR